MRHCQFNRHALPAVPDVLALLNLEPSSPNGSGYAQIRCPIHGESNPSLSIHIQRGNWRCFACGETGGDALELYRRARGLTFAQAARELGAWEPLLRLSSIVSVKLKYAWQKPNSSLLYFRRRIPDDIKRLLAAAESPLAGKIHYIVSLQTSDPSRMRICMPPRLSSRSVESRPETRSLPR